jgi:hypothetical protein
VIGNIVAEVAARRALKTARDLRALVEAARADLQKGRLVDCRARLELAQQTLDEAIAQAKAAGLV